MRSVFSILTVFAVCCTLLFIAGCEEQAKTPETSKEELTNPPAFIEDNSDNDTKPVGTTNNSTQPTNDTAETTDNNAQKTDNNTRTTDSTAKVAKKGPKITFKSEVYDFGEVKPGTKNKCEFTFTNTGNAQLKIKNIRPTCGCTVAKLAKKNYAPGESGTIKAVYSTGTAAARVHKTINVSCNDRTRPRVSLAIKGKIVVPVRHTPSSMTLMLNEENAKCPNITLRCVDDQPFAIKSFTATAGSISGSFDPNVQQTEFVIEPKVDLAKLERSLNGHITIELTHPKCKRVAIRYRVIPRFRLDPSVLGPRNVEPGKALEHTVLVMNNYNEDFEIEADVSKQGYMKVLRKEKIDKGYKLRIQITPPHPEPNENPRLFKDVLVIKVKGGEQLQINCRAFYAIKPKTLGRTVQLK